ncbi:MAG: hypothetical protein IT462_17450 [Planctomycetes bacterium]|nr:hypothetical protein [Planctomycetota bacterium]
MVAHATSSQQVVIACAYQGFVPAEVQKLLPAGFSARRYVAEIRDGEIVAVVAGDPETAVRSFIERAER